MTLIGLILNCIGASIVGFQPLKATYIGLIVRVKWLNRIGWLLIILGWILQIVIDVKIRYFA